VTETATARGHPLDRGASIRAAVQLRAIVDPLRALGARGDADDLLARDRDVEKRVEQKDRVAGLPLAIPEPNPQEAILILRDASGVLLSQADQDVDVDRRPLRRTG